MSISMPTSSSSKKKQTLGDIFDSDDEDNKNEAAFSGKNDFAARYDNWRAKEELQKFKDRYGEVDISSSSSSEDEDQNAQYLTNKLEKGFLKVLSLVKSRDAKIYDKETTFYSDDDEDDSEENFKQESTKDKKKKAMYLRDYERKVIQERGGKYEDVDEEDDGDDDLPVKDKTYFEQQAEIKESFKAAFENMNSESEDDDVAGNLLIKKRSTKSEKEKEEADYVEWLKGKELEFNNSEKKELQYLHDFWNKDDLDEGEKFLKDFILNKRYLEETQTSHHGDISEDDDEVDREEEFERKYNFRFEEPDAEFIKRYPRTIKDSVRRKDERRSKKRGEIRARKEEERQRKREELKQLKNLKKKEILEKLKKLKEVAGNDDLEVDAMDLEGDFDAAKHDEMMQSAFTDHYYGLGADDVKPVFSDLSDDEENWDDWKGGDVMAGSTECGGRLAPEPPTDDSVQISQEDKGDPLNGSDFLLGKPKKKRKSKFAEAIYKEKPVFDPKDKSFEEFFDEYYGLDYEDVVAGLPCRFRYRQVVPNSFGLSTDEILHAREQELNKWASLKKCTQYRNEGDEKYDVQAYNRKKENVEKKMKILTSLYQAGDGDNVNSSGDGKRKGKKKKKKGTSLSLELSNRAPEHRVDKLFAEKLNKKCKEVEGKNTKLNKNMNESFGNVKEMGKKKDNAVKQKSLKLKKKKKKLKEGDVAQMTVERMKAYGLNPKKFKSKLKPKTKNPQSVA